MIVVLVSALLCICMLGMYGFWGLCGWWGIAGLPQMIFE